jgi:hypothetical protein
MTTKSGEKPGYRAQGKARAAIKRIILLLTRSRWNMKEEKFWNKCLVKWHQIKKA